MTHSSAGAARRFFIERTGETGGVIEIGGSDAHKIAHVLRLSAGERIEVIDAAATEFDAEIEAVGRSVTARLLEKRDERTRPTSLYVDVAQAVPKGQRMDFVVEKGTELGARAVVPFFCERTIGRSVGDEKLARWRRLARSAAQQSGRHDVPLVADPLSYDALLSTFDEYDVVLFAWELAPPQALRDAVLSLLPARGEVLAIVGPEGGFSHAEAAAALERGATAISLGPRILRTDTAALALLAVIGALAS
ncbi:MAG: 16S rRNA (uracil(1498)-N(3))-methyltransferase [Candidatus Eremiobacteraeota bacterium]|nr:16S rRNA (uracil(1498)-N(3))-methyltransferase [Candidatus Eremiobacteraeota bacterium]